MGPPVKPGDNRDGKRAKRAFRWRLAGGLGFEPRQAESESAVLPLDDPPKPGSGEPGGVAEARVIAAGPGICKLAITVCSILVF